MVSRAEQLAHSLSQQPLEFVLCHSDAHPGNFLVTSPDQLYLVDWDNPIFAPKERDLMFFGGGMAGDQPGGHEQALFYQGYGPVSINLQALAYYRYERIIQDIAEFCKQLLLTSEGGEDREQAYHYLTSSFSPGNVVEAAVRTDQLLLN
jgi:spectinomycin phosphotransferase